MIRVVNVAGLNRPEQRVGICYVGRRWAGWPGHPLANPFRPTQGAGPWPLASCLERYRAWLFARPTLEADLAALWEATDRGAMPLGCWCVSATAGDGQPCVCHAQILAELLKERFAT
jgi:hypothetical protein